VILNETAIPASAIPSGRGKGGLRRVRGAAAPHRIPRQRVRRFTRKNKCVRDFQTSRAEYDCEGDMMEKKKKNEVIFHSSAAEYLTYVAASGSDERSFEMRYENENVWLTQKMMAALYDVSVQNIGQHIKKVFEDGELPPDSVIKKYFITAADGKDYETMHYNLQMIIAVGFKVNNDNAVQFRKWAGQIGRITPFKVG